MTELKKKRYSAQNQHKHCLLCGHDHPLSLGLRFQRSLDGRVRSQFTGSWVLQGYQSILHGGVTSALLDAAMTHCLFHRGVEAVTAELNVRYLHEIPYDVELELSAWLEKERKGLFLVNGEIRQDNLVMARSLGKFLVRGTAHVKV